MSGPSRPSSIGFADPACAALFAGYQPPADAFDEVFDADGFPRPHWREFLDAAGPMTPETLARDTERITRQLRANGVTYSVYAGADGAARPWSLDAWPLIIDAETWAALDRPLRQHARLLNALATDLYGSQTTIRDGLLPPALLARHSGYLHACRGVEPAGGVRLHIIAFDLAHDVYGRWCVVGRRTQAPSGLGYVLENRTTIARVHHDAVRALGPLPLAPFFASLQEVLLESSPARGERPHVVLLTPGAYSETYFEHAYLARELGMPLVQGADLVVRHDHVFLKTVSGLQPVHGIWRRQDDDYCDPLELRPASALGVPGLLQAWRAGNVLVANAFGMGVLESPVLAAYLPLLAERLLGEPLQMPIAQAWWYGDWDGRAAAAHHLANGVIVPAFPGGADGLVFASDLDDQDRARWMARLDADPEQYVIEQRLPFSHAPVWREGRIESRAALLRVFLVTDGRGDYRVLPGGLSRIARAERQVVSAQRGGNSKDTWVLAGAGVPAEPDLARPIERAHARAAVSSRTAEHLFWLGRYAERAENTARLARAVLSRLTDPRAVTPGLGNAFLDACRRQELSFDAPDPDRDATSLPLVALEDHLVAGVLETFGPRSVAFNIHETWRVGGTVRERLSFDNWRVLNQLAQRLPPQASAAPAPRPPARERSYVDLDAALGWLDEAILSLVAIGGLEMAHMTRDDGWRFLSLGRHLERLAFVASSLVDAASAHASDDPAVLEWLLDVSDSLITYRARHLRQPERSAVVELLLFDRQNPRSAMFQVAKLAKHVRLLPGADLIDTWREIDALHAAGEAQDARQGRLFETSMTLEALVDTCEQLAARVSDALTHRYFSHVYQSPQVTVAS